MLYNRKSWATYSWTLNGQRLEIPAPDLASARVAALAVVDERFKVGLLTDRLWTAWQSRIKAERPLRAAVK